MYAVWKPRRRCWVLVKVQTRNMFTIRTAQFRCKTASFSADWVQRFTSAALFPPSAISAHPNGADDNDDKQKYDGDDDTR